jgi:hypothetical protein
MMKKFLPTKLKVLPVVLIGLFSSAYIQAEGFDPHNRLNANPPVLNFEGATKFAPVFDYDGDSCFPAPAIDGLGRPNHGRSPTDNHPESYCRQNQDIDNAFTYHRQLCKIADNVEYCAHLYELYFEKDQNKWGVADHRHDIELVVVWTKQNGADQPDIASHVSISAHGELDTQSYSSVPKQGTFPKVVYHLPYFANHALRWAKSGERAEAFSNGQFKRPYFASYATTTTKDGATRSFADAVNSSNFGSASFKIKSSKIVSQVNNEKPSGYPEFTANDLENHTIRETLITESGIETYPGFGLN